MIIQLQKYKNQFLLQKIILIFFQIKKIYLENDQQFMMFKQKLKQIDIRLQNINLSLSFKFCDFYNYFQYKKFTVISFRYNKQYLLFLQQYMMKNEFQKQLFYLSFKKLQNSNLKLLFLLKLLIYIYIIFIIEIDKKVQFQPTKSSHLKTQYPHFQLLVLMQDAKLQQQYFQIKFLLFPKLWCYQLILLDNINQFYIYILNQSILQYQIQSQQMIKQKLTYIYFIVKMVQICNFKTLYFIKNAALQQLKIINIFKNEIFTNGEKIIFCLEQKQQNFNNLAFRVFNNPQYYTFVYFKRQKNTLYSEIH
ncbi:hypothetical protein pb186bvf_006230 [Paramecium bursaria]